MIVLPHDEESKMTCYAVSISYPSTTDRIATKTQGCTDRFVSEAWTVVRHSQRALLSSFQRQTKCHRNSIPVCYRRCWTSRTDTLTLLRPVNGTDTTAVYILGLREARRSGSAAHQPPLASRQHVCSNDAQLPHTRINLDPDRTETEKK